MKNWFSWIVRGRIGACIVAYATIGDPLFDAWIAVQSLDQAAQVESQSDEPCSNDDAGENFSPTWKSRFVQQQGGRFGREAQNDRNRTYQRDHSTTLKVFQESVADNWMATVQIHDRKRQVALGAIVSTDGWIVSKSSEIPDRVIEIRLSDNTKADGLVKFRRNDLDLAFIKIDRKDLPIIQWNTSAVVHVGGWLATTDFRKLPIAIGVISVASRKIRREKAYLGVELVVAPKGENGAMVQKVFEGGGADRAGVHAGDLITAIDGVSLSTEPDVRARLEALSAGQRADFGILRDGKKVLITAQMMDLNNSLLVDPTEMEVNGNISARATGFLNILQHDSVIAPHQCGGPIVDVNGNAVGLNIARAGRVSTYAIPASVLSVAIKEMLTSMNSQQVLDESFTHSPSKPQAVRTSIELSSVPNRIEVESLKPEVIVPKTLSRP